MEITIVSNYYPPEMGAASSRIYNMTIALSKKFDKVNVVTPLPNYPFGKIYNGYKSYLYKKEAHNNINIFRYWIYPSKSKKIYKRILSMFSFSISLWAYAFNLNRIIKSDWVIIQNSPLLVSFSSIILFKYIFKKKIALNVSDLWPLSALELGVIKRGKFYNFLETIETFNYQNSDLILGQSNEILDHVEQKVKKPNMLYRNLPLEQTTNLKKLNNNKNFKIVYAGLLGVAQGIYDIIKNLDFKKLNIEFDIYGEGNELSKITDYLVANPNCNINYKGCLTKNELMNILPIYNASLVPLKTYIKGAVPSKIFELVSLSIPILYMGDGEAANLIKKWGVGYVCNAKDFFSLEKNIIKISKFNSDYKLLCRNCKKITKNELDFKSQINNLIKKLI